jgi:proteic killer suppression protein
MGRRIARFVNVETVARRKLRQLEIAAALSDLRIPPGKRLESLKGTRTDSYSIRINQQWRVCFRWIDDGAEDDEIVAGKRAISADTDLRLCRFLGLSNGYWLRAQAAHDTEVAARKLARALKNITPWSQPST